MKLTINLFAAAKQIVGSNLIELEFEKSPTVAEVQTAIVMHHPGLSSLMSRSLLAVNHEYATAEQVLTDACEVALIPPVSGG